MLPVYLTIIEDLSRAVSATAVGFIASDHIASDHVYLLLFVIFKSYSFFRVCEQLQTVSVLPFSPSSLRNLFKKLGGEGQVVFSNSFSNCTDFILPVYVVYLSYYELYS